MEQENIDYVICQICKENGEIVKSSRLYGAHLKKHGITSEEYKKMYPGAPLTTQNDKKNTSKSSGLHMKTEEYKQMFSEKIKGDKNPNHKSKTTELQRKERSPFSKEFYKDKGMNDKEIESTLEKFREESFKDRILDTQIEYYLNQGYTEEESKKLLKERQTTFTLEKCILKYGEEKGKEVYTERQNKWQNSLLVNGNLKYGYSKASQELFLEILRYYNIDDIKYIYFATKNNEYRLNRETSGIWIYDFTDLKNKKMIEYNGDQYHANPKMFNENDTPHPFRKQYTSKDLWKKDEDKIGAAVKKGFSVFTIWDSEYRKDKEKTIQKCLDFLNLI